LPKIRRDHLSILRVLRTHLGASAEQALRGWGRRFGVGVDLHVGAIWSPESEQISNLLTSGAFAVPLHGPNNNQARLILDARLVGSLLKMILRTPRAPRVGDLTRAEKGLILFALSGLLHELGPDCLWSLDTSDSIEEEWVVVESTVTLGDARGLARLLMHPSILHHTIPSVGARDVTRLQRLAGLRVRVPVEVGRITLPLEELGRLGEGDVILSDDCPRNGTSLQALLRVGSGGFLATVAQNGEVTVGAPFRTGGLGMSTPETESTELAEQLPVQIVVELGRLQITGAQVLDLEQGDVLTLDRPLVDAVDLRVGDRLIARGDLVDVDGEAGVRLTEVYD
jgi:type III secretion system YscQ/HrcQ family protein